MDIRKKMEEIILNSKEIVYFNSQDTYHTPAKLKNKIILKMA